MTPPSAAAMESGAKAEQPIDTASGKNRGTENFPVGSVLIRPDLRVHVHALYNFARAADDISDHPLLEPETKVARLDRFAEVLLGKSDAKDAPAAVAMRESNAATGVTPQHCLDLLTAFKRDATQLRYRDWADLLDYCRYSASPVGRHVLALHGIGEAAWPSSDALCSALQIINHIQDCAADYAELDRVYIPQDMLAAYGGSISDLARDTSSAGLRAALDAMLQKLDLMMLDARDIPRKVPDVRLKCETAIIYSLAARLIGLLRRNDPLNDNVKLGKFSIACAGVTGLVRAWL